jgi:hypothetical protein
MVACPMRTQNSNQEEKHDMSLALRGKAATSLFVLLLVGIGLLAACGGSGLQDVEGPHMLYFYAEW